MPHVVKAKIVNAQQTDRAREVRAYSVGAVGENLFLDARHRLDNTKGLVREVAPNVIAHLFARVFHVSNENAAIGLFQVIPFNADDFLLAPCREQGEEDDLCHRQHLGYALLSIHEESQERLHFLD